MERVGKEMGTKAKAVLALACHLMGAVPAVAGTVLLAPPPPRAERPGEGYPESTWGQPPARLGREGRDEMMDRLTESYSATDSGGATRAPSSEAPSRATTDLGTRRATVPPESSESAFAGRTGPMSLNDTPSKVRRKGIQEVAVIAGDLGFFPKTFFVSRDIPVRIYVTGASRNTLCIMMDSFQVRKQIRSQRIEEITFTPSTPGSYRFYCPVNGMEGMMVVRELASVAVEL